MADHSGHRPLLLPCPLLDGRVEVRREANHEWLHRHDDLRFPSCHANEHTAAETQIPRASVSQDDG